jgi:hypothetical protein
MLNKADLKLQRPKSFLDTVRNNGKIKRGDSDILILGIKVLYERLGDSKSTYEDPTRIPMTNHPF